MITEIKQHEIIALIVHTNDKTMGWVEWEKLRGRNKLGTVGRYTHDRNRMAKGWQIHSGSLLFFPTIHHA